MSVYFTFPNCFRFRIQRTWCDFVNRVFFLPVSVKIHSEKSENGDHQLPETTHPFSLLFEGVETTDDSSPVAGGREHSSQSNFGLQVSS